MSTLAERPQRESPGRGGRHWQKRVSRDPLIALQIYVVVLILSPSIYVVAPLGAAGTPATILGVCFLVLWLVGRLAPLGQRIRSTPVRWFLGAVCLAALLSLVVGSLRPITSAEISSAERGIIMLASWSGVILMVADSLRTKERLDAFLRFLVLMGTVLGVMGIAQFYFGINFISLIHLPGLNQNGAGGGVDIRSGFPRVNATSLHSIEFAAVLGIILPVAVHLAFNAAPGRFWPWAKLALVFIAIPLTVSRSGMLVVLVGLAFAIAIATNRQRLGVLVAIPLGAFAFSVVMPGLLGTIRELFLDALQDQSVYGRLRDYEAVEAFVANSPVVGRGFFTFIPSQYRTLDNQFLGILVEQGFIGLIAFILLIGGAIALCLYVGTAGRDRYLKTQAFAIAAGLTSGAVLFATFDVFGFPMAMGTIAVVAGAAGAVWHVGSGAVKTQQRRRERRRIGRFGQILTAAIAVLTLILGITAIANAKDEFEATGSLVLGVPAAPGQNAYDSKLETPGMSDVITFLMESDQVVAALREEGVHTYTVAIGEGSREQHAESVGSGAMIWISSRANTAETALSNTQAVLRELQEQLRDLQAGRGIPTGLQIVAGDAFTEADVFEVQANRRVATVALAAFTILGSFLLVDALTQVPLLHVPSRTRRGRGHRSRRLEQMAGRQHR